MLKRLYEWWMGPATAHIARLQSSEFLEDARLEPNLEGETTHLLVLEFSEPVRDGNDISHINLRAESGVSFDSLELPTGDTAMRLPFNPSPMTLDLVFVTTESEVHATDRVVFVEEALQ